MSDQPTETIPSTPPTPQPQSTQQPANSVPTDDAGWLARLGVVGSVRVALGALGVAGLVLGAVVAWHAASATTLLIVSAVLLVFAALGFDWNKIRGTYGGWTVELLRDLGARIDQAAATAASGDVPPALRDELETLRAEVKALTPPERASRRPRATPTSTQGLDALFREVMATKVMHAFQRGGDAVQLTLRIVPLESDARYRCTIKTPSGGNYTALAQRRISLGASTSEGQTRTRSPTRTSSSDRSR